MPFLMSYGYNPVSALQGEPTPPRARVVEGIVFSSAVHNDTEPSNAPVNRSASAKPSKPSRIPTHYLYTVKKRIEIINEDLTRKNQSHKYELHSENNRHWINLLIRKENDEYIRWYTHEVTRSNYGSLLDKMSSGEGFIFDD
jgi:hypothetical protein